MPNSKQKCKILPGQVFGEWTVIERTDKVSRKRPFFLCLCSCGTKKAVICKSLINGISKSCGCIKRKNRYNKDLDLKRCTRCKKSKNSLMFFPKNNSIDKLDCYCTECRNKITAGRRLLNKQATPKWLCTEDKAKIKEIYYNCPKGYQVDHIVPLKGKNVCGLHVPWNLQYLTILDNAKKSNKLVVDYLPELVIFNKEARMTRKYENEYHVMTIPRMAKCGHISKTGRWFKCELCQPILPSDDNSGWEYFSELDEEEEGAL